MKEQTEYDKQAADFCAATGLTIKKQYTGHRPYFADDKEQRAVWSITFERPGRKPYTFTFGQSIVDSYKAWKYEPSSYRPKEDSVQSVGPHNRGYIDALANGGGTVYVKSWQVELKPAKIEPTDYDLLAGLSGRGYLSFTDFCIEMGYDSDSIKARDIWIACNEQAAAIESMFSQEEIEQLEEIR